ncbi:hypothetical protein [Dyadobacter frigoris]|uniref:Uncharacterized protein n=1 Tax=Dyadobacter frigoris TaxID=2576211 RepID=A0A4V6BKL3_9BACT|nr:hypothetical protein [Dyadobacter frigoris]TKT93263.1 hypothetical protein FDK13_05250 [Dyadobacter frigoris]GLU54895.1 hypothetical protein Dfri01_43560 [Dyadobacter frigoris]
MKASVFVFIVFLTITLGSCKEKEDAGPDLTSQLVGVRNTDYLILNQDDRSIIAQAKLNAANSIIKFSKKDNNTLHVQITLHDSKVEVQESFEAVVTEDKDKSDHFGRTGLLNNYRLVYKNAKGQEYNTGISLYKSGNVIGGLSYAVDKKDLMMSFGY